MRVPALTPQGGRQRLQFCRHRFKSLVMDNGVAHLEAKHAVVSSRILLPDLFPLKRADIGEAATKAHSVPVVVGTCRLNLPPLTGTANGSSESSFPNCYLAANGWYGDADKQRT